MEIFINKYLKEVNKIVMALNMSGKRVFLLLVSLAVMTSLFAGFVLAQQQQGDTFKLAEIFETIEGFDVFEAYQKFPFLIDTLIYFLFFIFFFKIISIYW